MKYTSLVTAVVVLSTFLSTQAAAVTSSALCKGPSTTCQPPSPFAVMVTTATQKVQAIRTSLSILQQRKTFASVSRDYTQLQHLVCNSRALALGECVEFPLPDTRQPVCTLHLRLRDWRRVDSVLKTFTTPTNHRTTSRYTGTQTHAHTIEVTAPSLPPLQCEGHLRELSKDFTFLNRFNLHYSSRVCKPTLAKTTTVVTRYLTTRIARDLDTAVCTLKNILNSSQARSIGIAVNTSTGQVSKPTSLSLSPPA